MIGLWDDKAKILYKKVDDSKHLMKMFNGSYGVDKAVLDAMPEGSRINITNQTGKVWEASKEDFLSYKALKNFEGWQYFLPRDKFPKRPVSDLPPAYKEIKVTNQQKLI